jgi:hypothetical protein
MHEVAVFLVGYAVGVVLLVVARRIVRTWRGDA